METILLVTVLAGTLVLLGFSAVLLRRVSAAAQVDVKAEVAGQLERLGTSLGQKFSAATADMASRLEQTKGDLRQQVADRAKPRLDSRSRRFEADGHHRAGAAETRSEHQGRVCPVRKSSAAPEGCGRAAP